MPFKKGQSGNPNGRPKLPPGVKELAAKHAPEAMMKIVDLMRAADPRVAFAAAQEIVNRHAGKPVQAVDATVRGGSLVELLSAINPASFQGVTDKEDRQVH